MKTKNRKLGSFEFQMECKAVPVLTQHACIQSSKILNLILDGNE
jgi:hypothetical protein